MGFSGFLMEPPEAILAFFSGSCGEGVSSIIKLIKLSKKLKVLARFAKVPITSKLNLK
jgi:hypothetical protein